MKAKACKLFST